MPAAPLIKFPRAELQALIEELTEVQCLWDGEPAPFLGSVNGKPGYYTELSVTATRTKGCDENRLEYDPINQVNGVTQISYRIYTITVKVKSYDKETPAFDVVDQIRRGLRSLTTKNRFVEIGLAFLDYTDSTDLPVAADSRMTSESTLDLKVAWQVAADPGDDDGGVIEKVGKIDGSGLTP